MSQDPMSRFGALYNVCISDEYKRYSRGIPRDELVFAILGVASSVLTTYLLSLVGIFV